MIFVSMTEKAPDTVRPSIACGAKVTSPSIPLVQAFAALSEKNRLEMLGSRMLVCSPLISTKNALPLNSSWLSNSLVFQPIS